MRALLKILAGLLLLFLMAGMAFYFIPLPPAQAAKLVAGEAAYFFEDEEDWLPNHSLPRMLWVKALEFKVRHDLKHHMAKRLALSEKDAAIQIYTAADEVRSLFITQQQQQVPIISNSTLASFVRGFGYCDQINGFLAIVLTDQLEKAQLYALQDPSGLSPHALIRSESSLGVVWVDAFSCLSAFGFPEELSKEGKAHIPHYSHKSAALHPASYYRQAVFMNDFSLAHTGQKALARLSPLLKPATAEAAPQTSSKTGGIAMAQNRGQQAEWLLSLHQESLLNKQNYLKARVYHLFDQKAEALHYYQEVMEAAPEGFLSSYASSFTRRIKQEEKTCTSAVLP